MGSVARKVIQAEFFFINDVTPPEEAMNEAWERLQEGSRIKMVVRFYDLTGTLSRLLQKLRTYEDRFTTEIISFQKNSRWNRWFRKARITWVMRKRNALRSKTLMGVRSNFVTALTQENGVAIEDLPGDHFRPVERNETYELKQLLSFSKYVWVFAFEPGDLFSDELSIECSTWI